MLLLYTLLYTDTMVTLMVMIMMQLMMGVMVMTMTRVLYPKDADGETYVYLVTVPGFVKVSLK